MAKIDVQNLLVDITNNLSGENFEGSSLTSEKLAVMLNVARNTVSQYLNELVKEGFAFKVKSRPAYFFAKEAFENKFFKIDKNIFENFEELTMKQSQTSDVTFDQFVGSHLSMKQGIDQIKSCVHYPNGGLPFMLFGDTGVGKSLLAKLTRDYCKNVGLVAEDAPFYELNCSQYYHNQELLSSILFGYKKGAFTGADEDHVGLLEASDGGVLFLDECHRLGPESQEKLFTFLDNGSFTRVGDNQLRYAKVRIIFATTENIKESFLRTFLRRIPITINIPSLTDRTKHELSELIYTFFINEAKNLDRELIVSSWIINRLMNIKFEDNVGELKNTIKFICASAYSRQTDNAKLMINSSAITDDLFRRLLSVKEVDEINNEDIVITKNSSIYDFVKNDSGELKVIRDTFKRFGQCMDEYKKEKHSPNFLESQLAREANTAIDILVNMERDDQSKVGIQFLTSTLKEILSYIENVNYIRIKGNFVVALSNYLYFRGKIVSELPFLDAVNADELLTFTKERLPVEEKVVMALLKLIETKLDNSLSTDEQILITYYLKSLNMEVKRSNTRAVILSHGFSTASSIADVVNHFFDEHVFESFDMPIDISFENVKEKMIQYINQNDCSKGLVLLVDMGSLLGLGEKLVEFTNAPVLIMNNVTTPQAIFVGEMIKDETDIELIGTKVLENLKSTYDVKYPTHQKEELILTVNQGGLQGAEQIRDLILSAKPASCNFAVEAIELSYLERYGKNNSLFKQYEVKGIIGTTDPKFEDVTYLTLEDLIGGSGEKAISKIFDFISEEDQKKLNNNLIKNLSIDRLVSAITILDVKQVTEYIEEFIQMVEDKFEVSLLSAQKAVLYLHIAGFVERIIRNSEFFEYPVEDLSDSRMKTISTLKRLMNTIEKAYNIKVPEDELQYLYDIIF